MIGVFDSGVGGLTALAALRARLPRADLCYFADTGNAPYGTKSDDVLCRLVKADIDRLRRAGCQKILIACGTAGSVYEKLPPEYRRNAFPILRPAAKRAARVTKNGRIGILATDATVRIGALAREVRDALSDAVLFSVAAAPLVTLAEEGRTSDRDPVARQTVKDALAAFSDSDIDTLILGCTHFSRLSALISREMPGVRLVCAAEEGARAFFATLTEKEKDGGARLLFLKDTETTPSPKLPQ